MTLRAIDLDPARKLALFLDAQAAFVQRLGEDRNILAAVRIGSLNEELIWMRRSLRLWLIQVDGVTRRLRSDGLDERVFRSFVEEGVQIHVELIERTRFKRMVEGASRTAFSCSFFASRELIYCEDPSIESWFASANRVGDKDQARELFATFCVLVHALEWCELTLRYRDDKRRCAATLAWAAHEIAACEVVLRGELCEDDALGRAAERAPELFGLVYDAVQGRKPAKAALEAAIAETARYLDEHAEGAFAPVLEVLRKQRRVVPFSELCELFAHTQLYPWHLETALEWLEQTGRLEKVGAPFQITKKSRSEVEEAAYFLDA